MKGGGHTVGDDRLNRLVISCGQAGVIPQQPIRFAEIWQDKEIGLRWQRPISIGCMVGNLVGDTFLVVNMIDGAQMRIKENSAIKISEYKMKSGFEKGSISVIDLIKGGLRKITGSIASSPFGVYRFQTGVMTIGVRGTDFVVKLCNGLDCSQSANRNDNGTKLHVVVLDGLITLQDEEGVQGELIMGQYAVATADTKIIVDDVKPVNGMLLEEERDIFNQFPDEPVEKENKGIWPWLIGGALLGIGL